MTIYVRPYNSKHFDTILIFVHQIPTESWPFSYCRYHKPAKNRDGFFTWFDHNIHIHKGIFPFYKMFRFFLPPVGVSPISTSSMGNTINDQFCTNNKWSVIKPFRKISGHGQSWNLWWLNLVHLKFNCFYLCWKEVPG